MARPFRDDEVTDLIETGLEQIRQKSHRLERDLDRVVRKLERISTRPPKRPPTAPTITTEKPQHA